MAKVVREKETDSSCLLYYGHPAVLSLNQWQSAASSALLTPPPAPFYSRVAAATPPSGAFATVVAP